MSSDKLSKLLKKAKKDRDVVLLAQALSLIDRLGPSSFKAKEIGQNNNFCFRIGITGPPGAGKSTLISTIISELRAKELSVAVLAVDPSSPISKGALLGDRIRMMGHFADEKVFLRSIGSRGFQGGLSSNVYLMARALEYFGFDFIIIETVGVGQTELEIMNVADLVAVVLVPESGDSIQAMKAGLLEIGDLFIINKSDRPGADELAKEIKTSLNKETFSTEAINLVGTKELTNVLVQKSKKGDWKKNRASISRIRAEAKALLEVNIREQIEKKIARVKSAKDLATLF